MKIIHKSYKLRIYPTQKQEILFAKHFGCARFVYNRFLQERQDEYLRSGKSLNYYDDARSLTLLKKELVWLKEVSSQSVRNVLKDLDNSYCRFFKKLSKFPKFKKRSSKQSFHIPQYLTIINKKLSIPKFREGINIIIHRKIEGKILNGTIIKTATGKYYISIVCRVEHQELPLINSPIGIDTGIKDLAILSNRTKYENIKSLRTSLKKLKYEQRQLSKKKKGSGQRNKQRVKLALLYEKVANKRKDHLHKVSTDIIKNHDIICIEDLNVSGMIKNHKLAQALSDVSLGMFYEMLKYKASWNNRTIVKIGRFFPSTKTCSNCNLVKENLTLKDRKWTCEGCGVIHDRDINAAQNILLQGLKDLSVSGIDSDIK